MGPALGAVQSLIDRVGAYAGLAAMVGIAVLALLYFAQAREVKRLREWAGRSPERAQELEERVAAQAEAARRASGPAVAPRPEAARPTASPAPASAGRASQPAPAAPVATAAPALLSATPFPGLTRSPAPASGAVSAAATSAPATPDAAPVAPVPSSAPATTIPPRTPAATAKPPGATPATRTGNGDAPVTTPPMRSPAQRPRPAPVTAASRQSTTVAPGRSRSRSWRALAVAGALLVAAAAVFAVIQLTGGSSGSKTAARAGTPAAAQGPGPAGHSFHRGSAVVTVLNGTPQAGIAHQVSARLVRDGFKQGTVTNASDQQRSATEVAYFPGHRRDAIEVRRALKVRANVQPVDASTRAIACPQPNCTTTVVVTVGSDL